MDLIPCKAVPRARKEGYGRPYMYICLCIYIYNDAMIYNHNNHDLRITGDVIIDQTIRYASKQV